LIYKIYLKKFNLIKKQNLKAEGIARPKEMIAIMGASGSGKTTLLNALNMRNQEKLLIKGEIRINGTLIESSKDITSISAYVQQDDLFFGHLTVIEHLRFQVFLFLF